MMMRGLAIAHFAIAILLIPVSLFPITLAPIMLIGPVWTILLARRMWRRDPTVIRTLRRTHVVFLLIDALLVWYGFWMLRAAEESAARGGGLLGGIGVIPIGLGIVLGCFSLVTLAFARPLHPTAGSV
jgi:hypothetical protein